MIYFFFFVCIMYVLKGKITLGFFYLIDYDRIIT